jgi:hypothetical protein
VNQSHAVTHHVRVRGLVRGVALATDATGAPMQATVAHTQLLLRDNERMLAFGLLEIDGVGVRSGECVIFLDGGDVIECVGEAAPALGSSLAQVLFAPPELLRASRAPVTAGAHERAAWEAAMSPLVDAGAVLRRASDVRSAVRDATIAVFNGFERIPLLLLGGVAETPAYRARAARLTDALAPAAQLGRELATAAEAVRDCRPDVLCRQWRQWVATLERMATALRDQVPACVDASTAVVAEQSTRWFSAWRRAR